MAQAFQHTLGNALHGGEAAPFADHGDGVAQAAQAEGDGRSGGAGAKDQDGEVAHAPATLTLTLSQRERGQSMMNPFSTRFVRPGELPYFFRSDESAEQLAAKFAAQGWRALTVWECELKDLPALEQRLRAFLA